MQRRAGRDAERAVFNPAVNVSGPTRRTDGARVRRSYAVAYVDQGDRSSAVRRDRATRRRPLSSWPTTLALRNRAGAWGQIRGRIASQLAPPTILKISSTVEIGGP